MSPSRTFKTGNNFMGMLYRFTDIASILGSFFLSLFLYGLNISELYLASLFIVTVSYLYIAEMIGLYRSWRAGTLREMLITAICCIGIAFFILFLVAFFFKFTGNLSRITLGMWVLNSIACVVVSRVIVKAYKEHKLKLGFNARNVAIIGATKTGISLYDQIKLHKELGYRLAGFFEDRSPDRVFEEEHYSIEGRINEAIERARRGEIDVLFIALPLKAEKRIADILLKLGDTTVDVHCIPDFLLSNLMHARIEHLGNIDTLSVFESPYLGAKRFVKRTEDIMLSLIILTLISPLLLFIAIGIKLTSKGPVLFKQYRYGLGGQKIKVWKFRSMKVMENSQVVTQATKGDPRVTPFGAFLRRTSLDELPQFFNSLTGEMSIVGPRPHAVAHNEEYRSKVDFYMLRHKVKPGITGWAQINGWRGETDTLEKMEKRVEYDLHYIKYWSLYFDLKIVFLTIFKGFVGKNAY